MLYIICLYDCCTCAPRSCAHIVPELSKSSPCDTFTGLCHSTSYYIAYRLCVLFFANFSKETENWKSLYFVVACCCWKFILKNEILSHPFSDWFLFCGRNCKVRHTLWSGHTENGEILSVFLFIANDCVALAKVAYL